MVDNDISHRIAAQRIVTTSDIGLPAAETHITDDDIMRVHPKRFPCYTDPVTGSRLTFDADIGSPDDDRAMQVNDTGHIEDHYPRPALLAGPAQRTGTRVPETRDHIYFPTMTTIAMRTPAFRTGECQYRGLWQVRRPPGPGNIRLAMFGVVIYNWKSYLPGRITPPVSLFYQRIRLSFHIRGYVRILCRSRLGDPHRSGQRCKQEKSILH